MWPVPVAAPELSNIDPDAEATLVPLTTVTEPPVPDVAVPAMTDTAPPTSEAVAPWDTPALSTNTPPAPDVPLPTVMLTAPPRPLLADPVPIHSLPVFPELVVPELNTSPPDSPKDNALAVDTVTSPEPLLAL